MSDVAYTAWEAARRKTEAQLKAAKPGSAQAKNLENLQKMQAGVVNDQRTKMNIQDELSAERDAKDLKKMNSDMSQGEAYGKRILGPDGLGRLGNDKEVKSLENRLNSMSQGYTGAELQAKREQALTNVQNSGQAQQRALQAALAKSGVKGGAAGAQMTDLAMEGARQRSNVERDLFVADADFKRQGLADFGKFQLETKQYDLGQAAAEKNIIANSGLTFAQMGLARRGAEAQTQAQLMAADIAGGAACFPAGTLVEMADGSQKEIQDIQVGDEVLGGGRVNIVGHGRGEELYLYDETLVTGLHGVIEDGYWIHVRDSKLAQPTGIVPEHVFNLYCENHIMVIDGRIFSDFIYLEDLFGVYGAYPKTLAGIVLRHTKAVVESVRVAARSLRSAISDRIAVLKRRHALGRSISLHVPRHHYSLCHVVSRRSNRK